MRARLLMDITSRFEGAAQPPNGRPANRARFTVH
jgi:hypothetical protein